MWQNSGTNLGGRDGSDEQPVDIWHHNWYVKIYDTQVAVGLIDPGKAAISGYYLLLMRACVGIETICRNVTAAFSLLCREVTSGKMYSLHSWGSIEFEPWDRLM